MSTYNIVVKHRVSTRKRGEVVEVVEQLSAARKAVAKWEDYLLDNSGPDWKVEYRIVRH